MLGVAYSLDRKFRGDHSTTSLPYRRIGVDAAHSREGTAFGGFSYRLECLGKNRLGVTEWPTVRELPLVDPSGGAGRLQ